MSVGLVRFSVFYLPVSFTTDMTSLRVKATCVDISYDYILDGRHADTVFQKMDDAIRLPVSSQLQVGC